ncbi:MAG: cobalamin-dependent protein, partial [Candidatus Nanoarchaeia archaeon]
MEEHTQLIQEDQKEQSISISKQLSVLLITVQSNTDVIGLKYLHAYLRKNSISSRILILPDYNEIMNGAVEKFFNETKPQLVGLSVLSTEFPEIEKLSVFLKSKYKFISFMGGYHAAIDPQECLKYADFVVRGEAEDVLLEVCNTLKAGGDISKIPNLAYMQNDFFVQNKMREPETNLDKYPFHENLPPETYIFDHGEIIIMNNALFKKYSRYNGRFYSLTTTRGCNLRCGFCIHSFLTKLRKEE